MKNILYTMLAIVCLVAATIGAAVSGFDSLTFQMPLAYAVVCLVLPHLPSVDIGLGLLRADDAADQLVQLTKDLADTRSDLRKQQDGLKDAHAEVMKAISEARDLDREKRENIDKAISKANETGEQVKELAQKIDDLGKSVNKGQERRTVRGELTKELEANKDKYEALKGRQSNSLLLTMKDITSVEAAGLLREPYIDTLVGMERRPLRVRDLLTSVPVQSDSVKYAKQTLRTNMAKIVAEGTQKPYSQYKWETQTASIETIAHLAKLTLQAIADAPRLVAEVESEMRFGLAFAEEDELLNGDNTSGHLNGLMNQATAYAVPAGLDSANVLTQVDMLRVAILQIHLAYAAPDAHVLNPIDIANIELLRRDPDKGGGYLFGNPDSTDGILRLWRLPTVESASMEVNDFLTGAFKYGAHLYDRQGVTVQISTENDTDFELNQATMRVESRIGLGVRRPYAFVAGSFGGS